MNQKRVHKTYTQEFKKEAVALVTDQGYSVAEAARSLGVNTNLLYKWKEQQEAQASGAALSTDEREELKKLWAENKRLRMEKDILKKASVDSSDQSNSYIKILLFIAHRWQPLIMLRNVSWKELCKCPFRQDRIFVSSSFGYEAA